MLQFGMPTLIETDSIEACAGLCSRLGLGFIELNMNLPEYQEHMLSVPDLKSLAGEYGIGYTIHLDENFNPCDFNPEISSAYIRTAVKTIAKAGMLGAPLVNMHLSMGVYFTLPDQRVYLFDRCRDNYLSGMTTFRDTCGPRALDAGVTICVENSDGYTGFQLEALDLLLEHPAFALTYDVGHDHAIGGSDRGHILSRGDRLCHMHLHDAAGRKNHMVLGTGDMDIDDCLALAQAHDCRVVLETKTVDGLRRSADWLRERGYL